MCPAVKISEGQSVELRRHLVSEVVDDLLRNVGHYPALHDSEQQAAAVKRQQQEQYRCESAEIYPHAAHQPFDHLVGRVAEYRRRDYREYRAGDREYEHYRQSEPVRFEVPDQGLHRLAEIFCLFPRHHPATGTARTARAFSSLSHYLRPLSSSSSLSCDSAISLYTSHVCISSSCVPFPARRPSSSTRI